MNTVREIGPLKQRAMELLRRHDSFMSTGSVAAQLGVPTWAAGAALDAARLLGEVEYSDIAGWRALSHFSTGAQAAMVDDGQAGLGLAS